MKIWFVWFLFFLLPPQLLLSTSPRKTLNNRGTMHGMSPPAHLRSSAGLLHLYFDFNCRDLFSSFSFSFFSNSRGKTAGDSREYDVLEKYSVIRPSEQKFV